MTELVRTVQEFEDKRNALILEHTQNKGRRGFSYDTTMLKIGALLGFDGSTQAAAETSIVPQKPAPIAAALTEENGAGEDKDVIDAALVPVGQTRLAGEDVMPTHEVVDKDGALSKARKAYDNLILKVSDLERETKKIKNDALAPYKDEIDEKNSMVALMTFAADYWNVAALMEEARVKSAHEDPVFCVYAWVTCGKKDVFTAVGTRQDVADKASEVGSQFVFTIAEFEHGEDCGGEELTEPAGTSEPDEQEEEQD